MKHLLIVGGGVIGLCTAYYAARKGHRVTVLDRRAADHEGCSYGNAGLVVPSHFVPLAAPGMVALGLKWMRRPDSPFYVKPRLDRELISWGLNFWRAANAEAAASRQTTAKRHRVFIIPLPSFDRLYGRRRAADWPCRVRPSSD